MKRKQIMGAAMLVAAAAGACALGMCADEPAQKVPGYTDTPMLPGGKWHVHDPNRPLPPIVTPGTPSTQEAPGKPPSDAIVLFDGKDLSKWQLDNGKDAPWTVQDGYAEVHGGQIRTKDKFGDMQLHVEWQTANPPKGTSQERGNSGIFLMSRYEIQVLDNYNNITYPDGQAGAIYGQTPPSVNASLPPGQWQTYDIFFTAPRWKDNQLQTPAYVTIVHNGVLVQNHTEIIGSTGHRILAKYTPDGPEAPITLQDHGNPDRYRNIWVRRLQPQE